MAVGKKEAAAKVRTATGDPQHTPEHMGRVLAAALNAYGARVSELEALALVQGYLNAAPHPPKAISVKEKLVAGVVAALR